MLLTAIILLIVLILVEVSRLIARDPSLEQRVRDAELLRDKAGGVVAALYRESLQILGDNPDDPVAGYAKAEIESGLTPSERGKLNVR